MLANTPAPFILILISSILLEGVVNGALTCNHCVCEKDCAKNSETSRTCPDTDKACFSDITDSKTTRKGCTVSKDKGSALKHPKAKRHYCDSPSCNKASLRLHQSHGLMALIISVTAYRLILV